MATENPQPDGNSQLKAQVECMELADGTVKLLDEGGHVRNIPVPTDHPDDPLIWSLRSRGLVFLAICIYGITGFGVVQSAPLFFSDMIADYMKETRGEFNPSRIGDLASYPSLCMGLGNFLFVPLSLVFGRRPMLILCAIIMVASVIWAAKSDTFNSHLGARCLQGLTAGVSDCLLPLIVLDTTFLHNRGFWMTLYWSVTAIGSSLMLVIVPFLVHSQHDDWRINYWFWLGWAVLTLILVLTCLRETMFYREPALLNGQIVISDAYGQVHFEAIAGDHQTPNTRTEYTEKKHPDPYIKQMLPIRYKHRGSKMGTFIRAYVDMAICFTHPAIFWTLLLNSVLFSGLVILSLTYEALLVGPPWSFSPQAVGTSQIGSVIGAAVAFLVVGMLVEHSAERLTRRNGGIREPEHLLPSFAVPVILGFLGLCIYGVVGGSPFKYSWVGIHAAFALYFFCFIAISAISSVWVAELVPKRAGPAIVLICGGRNAASFGISHAFPSWIQALGLQNAHISLGGIFIGIAIFGIPLYFVDRRIRKLWSSYFQ
ncbi:hypothetical protein CLAIMM_10367 [Cladophialophora immunda]|nr:hypothetical protein CLAIMM_10367 [Cladophialophora immunda]